MAAEPAELGAAIAAPPRRFAFRRHHRHHDKNEKMAIYFWFDVNKRKILHPQLQRALYDAELQLDFSNLQQYGTSTKNPYRHTVLTFFGAYDAPPKGHIFDLQALTSDVGICADYFSDITLNDGSGINPHLVKRFCSSLMYLFKRYDFQPPERFFNDLKVGVTRVGLGATRDPCQQIEQVCDAEYQ